MADKLSFSLVSPAREVFSGEVDHVIAPGSEGEFGVLPKHAPFMTTLRNGLVRVLGAEDGDMRIFVRSGFADVTPEGLTILAEEAVDLADLNLDAVRAEIEDAEVALGRTETETAAHQTLSERIAFLNGLVDAAA
ncbi:MAG: ATP synthase F1 subunit epsilon [Pseudomonadota bacterium]